MRASASRRRRWSRELVRRFGQAFVNPFVLRSAGRKNSPFVILHHEGRKTGQEHRIPVQAVRAGRWFIIPLPYGEDVNWCRNVFAASHCVIEWRANTYDATDPRMLDLPTVTARLGWFQRMIQRLTGTKAFLMLRASTPRESK